MVTTRRFDMSDIEKQIGARITQIRLSRKLTQAQLAEKANLSVETISRMERGVTFPSLKTLENIACSLDTHLKNFFDFGKEQPRDQNFEREIAKLSAFLRTLETKEITLVYEILKVVFRKLK